MGTRRLFRELSPAAFLREYWQRRPLLVRGAFGPSDTPLTPEELAGLACEPDVESRIVEERTDHIRWHLRQGPFSEETFQGLPHERWTLLVQDVDKHLPELRALLDCFRFLPDWRIDDLMISYAAPGGSVGPHVDRYDVFLIQGPGRREWRIDEHRRGEAFPHPDLDLIRTLEATASFVLEPGDMLYLPPGVPHHGIALDPCLTYSVGFRAPSLREVAAAYCERLMQRLDDDLYVDPPLSPIREPADLPTPVRRAIQNQLGDLLAPDPALLEEAFAQVVSEPKPAFIERSPHDGRASMHGANGIRLHPWSRQALVPRQPGARLYADGQPFDVPASDLTWLRELLRKRSLPAGRHPLPGENVLLRDLLTVGVVEYADD